MKCRSTCIPSWSVQRCHEGVTSAPRQDNRLKADVSVIADVVVKKYVEHQPLYRQQQGFDRLHIPISRQTLCDWTGWCSDQVEPIVKAMAEYICAQPLIQSDETPVRMQLADGQMETARLWAYGLPWAEVVFDFRTDKSQKGPKEFLQGTTAGFLQTDGGSSYVPVVKALELLHVACMAHIRRGLFEARADAPLAVDLLLAAIQKLYRIESRAKAMGLSLEARLQLRQREAKPIFMDVGQLIATLRKDVLPKSPLGQALSYAENQWPAMARYLEVAQAELDNNSTEHALRGSGAGPAQLAARRPGGRGREGRQSLLAHDHLQTAGGRTLCLPPRYPAAAAQPSEQGHLATDAQGLEGNLRLRRTRRPVPAAESFRRSTQLSAGSITP